MKPPAGFLVDHKDGNGLDNRRANLRYATHTQNMQNRKPNRGKLLPKGVTWDGYRYIAQIKAGGEAFVIGRYKSVEEAAEAYDKAALEHHGEFARPNSPVKEVSSAMDSLPLGNIRPPMQKKTTSKSVAPYIDLLDTLED
jgi:hypothetical protein